MAISIRILLFTAVALGVSILLLSMVAVTHHQENKALDGKHFYLDFSRGTFNSSITAIAKLLHLNDLKNLTDALVGEDHEPTDSIDFARAKSSFTDLPPSLMDTHLEEHTAEEVELKEPLQVVEQTIKEPKELQHHSDFIDYALAKPLKVLPPPINSPEEVTVGQSREKQNKKETGATETTAQEINKLTHALVDDDYFLYDDDEVFPPGKLSMEDLDLYFDDDESLHELITQNQQNSHSDPRLQQRLKELNETDRVRYIRVVGALTEEGSDDTRRQGVLSKVGKKTPVGNFFANPSVKLAHLQVIDHGRTPALGAGQAQGFDNNKPSKNKTNDKEITVSKNLRGSVKNHSSALLTPRGDNQSVPLMTCREAFPPQCEMYDYVRFWNRRFYPEDCYTSPLRPALKDKTPIGEQKFVVFAPDGGGWNNIRMAAEVAIVFAHTTGRTLVLPPRLQFYLLNKNKERVRNRSSFDMFFDLDKVREALTIMSMRDFLLQVALPGLLKAPLPQKIKEAAERSKNETDFASPGGLWKYLEEASFVRQWEPGKFFLGFNISSTPPFFGSFDLSKSRATNPRYVSMVAHGRRLVPYDTEMHGERAIFFPGDYRTSHRILTHYYTYLYWADFHTEQIYKRIVRDRLHYRDPIFCAAGKIVRWLQQQSVALKSPATARFALPPWEGTDEKTRGGDTRVGATYFAFHVRRGDFQFKETRVSAESIWDTTKHLLDANRSTLIYIATDEKDKSFFSPFMKKPFNVLFLSDFLNSPEGRAMMKDEDFNQNYIGMIEQVVCANAHTFVGTPKSSFTGYITRMRGYYRDGRYSRTFYSQPTQMMQLQTQRDLIGPFWAREFEKAHYEIDDYF